MKDDYQFSVITKIRKLRVEQGMSQARLATKLGLSDGHLGNIESIRSPHKYKLSQIYAACKLFNVPIEEILIGKSEHKSRNDIIDLLVQKIIEYEK